jgi:hypothetical protein
MHVAYSGARLVTVVYAHGWSIRSSGSEQSAADAKFIVQGA